MQDPDKFFFIDDDADDRDFFCTAMQMIDPAMQCIFAKDGVDGIEQLRNDPTLIPAYIFIDMNMPRMDGKECLKELRTIDRLAHVPVYMYSTAFNPKVNEELIASGATGILVKPSTINNLHSLLREILNQPTAE